MATTYEGYPPVDEILRGAAAIALGRLVEVVERSQDADTQRTLLTYRVKVDDVLAGDLSPEILLRLVGDREDRDTDRQRLLVLTPDLGRADKDRYVIHFAPPSSAKNGRYAVGDKDTVSLDEIKKLLSTIAARRQRRAEELAEEERGQDLEQPYPEVAEVGAGRGDTTVEATLAEPLGRPDEATGQAEPGRAD